MPETGRLGPSVLVGCAHGTRDPGGRRTVARLLIAAAQRRPGLLVEPAFVDVQPPRVGDVLADCVAAGRRPVVVPLLLSAGYHVHVDIAEAVRAAPGAVAAAALGPDARLVEVLVDRLHETGVDVDDAVVLAAAGSSDARAVADVERVAAALRDRWSAEVTVGYGASASPSVPQAVEAARRAGARRVVVAGYLLAPGFFHDRLSRAGADLVTAPLASPDTADPRLVDILLDRYDAAL